MTTSRRNNAEEGVLHKLARRLDALFKDIVPPVTALINAYGRRVTDISALPSVNPKGTGADGAFKGVVGADGTSIWSAATSGSTAIAVHLLACMLAQTFEASEATSILVEVVEERRKEIRDSMDEAHIGSLTDKVVISQEITRSQLANWDASARSWILSADGVKKKEQTQLKLITQNIELSMNSSTKTYRNVVDAWTSAMVTLNHLICSRPQRISNAAVLIGISAWHIFPDLFVVGDVGAHVKFYDELVDPGGCITIGLQGNSPDNDDGVRWSLSLSHLRYYGKPVPVSKSTNTDGTRITIGELRMVALGSLISEWSYFVSDFLVAARLLSALWDSIKEELCKEKIPGLQWLWRVVSAALELLASEVGPSRDHLLMLIALGRRRGSTFLGSIEKSAVPMFGLCSPQFLTTFSSELSSCTKERAIAILRNHAEISGLDARECLIRYQAPNGLIEFCYCSLTGLSGYNPFPGK